MLTYLQRNVFPVVLLILTSLCGLPGSGQREYTRTVSNESLKVDDVLPPIFFFSLFLCDARVPRRRRMRRGQLTRDSMAQMQASDCDKASPRPPSAGQAAELERKHKRTRTDTGKKTRH